MLVPRLYEDLSVLHQNTMPDRAYYIPAGGAPGPDPLFREQSDRLQMLSGCPWSFQYYPSIHDLTDAFYKPDYEPGRWWKKEEVPFSWQMRGYDCHQYTNIRYPFPFDPPYVPQDNPCGAYLHRFEWHRSKEAPCEFLCFEGVDSCFYVWLNGAYVGYSQVSHHTSEFDVTDYLQEGENLLAVLVLKWCDGSYLEDQDKFRMSGIFRDVYLLHRPADRIEDYVIRTDLTDGMDHADIRIRFRFSKKTVPVRLTLKSPGGEILTSLTAHTEEVTIPVEAPLLWNAEEPWLYGLTMDTGREVIREQVGIRRVEVRDLVLTLNGSPITFRGVNRHESDPVTGAVVTKEQAVRDLTMIKAHNFNAVRASHYPNVPWFYQLCDSIGLYVIDEADNESHGTGPLTFAEDNYDERMKLAHVRIADNPDFVEPTLDRVRSMVIRNRNRPCILVWSMGNECGYGRTFEESLAWTKATDPGRLTHYESAYYLPADRTYDLSNIDLFGRMYPPFEDVINYLEQDPDKPLLLVEYCHSMGNGPGDFMEYRDLTEKYPALCGGFVWEWCDHGIDMGTAANGKRMYGYGGDFGELQHDDNFCLDGLVYPDRTPHTGLLEYRNVHRPVRASYDRETGLLTLTNHLDFADAADRISAAYSLTLDGTVIAKGPVAIPSLKPHASVSVPLTLPVPDKGRCFLMISYVQKTSGTGLPAGQDLGFDEIPIPTAEPVCLKAMPLRAPWTGPGEVKAPEVTQEGNDLVIRGDGFAYRLDTLTGLFTSLETGGEELLDAPIAFNVWRAPTDNDRPVMDIWKLERLDHTYARAYQVTWEDAEGCLRIRVSQSLGAMSNQPVLRMENQILICPDGRICLKVDAAKDPAYDTLPRIGLRLFLKGTMKQVDYYGMGPSETYIDKHHSGSHGFYRDTLAGLMEDYIRPQESGSHYDCDFVSVKGKGASLTLVSGDDQTFSFSALPYTQEELEGKRHNYELVPCGSTVLCVDHKMAGIGSKSCGPDLPERYRVSEDRFRFAFILKPEKL